MADREPIHFDVALPSIFEPTDAIGSKDQIKVERSILELDEILSSLDLSRLVPFKRESEFSQREHHRAAIASGSLRENVCIGVVSGKPSRIAPDLPRNR